MKFKHGDTVEVGGYLGEVIKVTESYIEVLYGGVIKEYLMEQMRILQLNLGRKNLKN